jgi:hypothetical protein
MHARSDDNIIVVGWRAFSGLRAAVALQQNGYRYTAIESAEAIADMWPDNRYLAAGLTPGAICTHLIRPIRLEVILRLLRSDAGVPTKRCRGTYEEMQGNLEDVASRFHVVDVDGERDLRPLGAMTSARS